MLFQYPLNAKFGRVVPKNKIYEHAKASSEIQRKFVDEIEQINWTYKLSPETLNIPADEDVREIQIFTLKLRSEFISEETLKTIDRAIPFPILFELVWGDNVQAVAGYKRQSEADTSKWVISTYFWSGWLPASTTRNNLPTAIDMGSLYEKLVKSILPVNAREAEPLRDHVNRVSLVDMKQKEIARLLARIKKEKQFNRKVELNKQLKNLKCELEELLA